MTYARTVDVADGFRAAGRDTKAMLAAAASAEGQAASAQRAAGKMPEDFGVVGGANDTAALQATIDAVGYLNLGKDNQVYKVSRLKLKSGTRIEGRGVLDFSGNAAFASSVFDPLILARGQHGAEVALTADLASGDGTVQITSTTGIARGDLIEVSTPGHNGGFVDTSVGVVNAELFTVAEVVSPNSLRFVEPVSDEGGFSVANGAVLRRIQPVEDIYIGPDVMIIGKGRPASGSGDVGVTIAYGRRARVHCKFKDVDYSAVRFESCYDYEASGIRLVHAAKGANTSVNYGIVPSSASKYGRVYNCHLENMRHGVVTSHLSSALTDNGTPVKIRGVVRFLHVKDCTFVNTWHAGFATHNDADLVTVEGCTFNGCAFGVNPRERRITIRRNEFQGCTQDISLTAHPRDLTIEENISIGSKDGSFIISNLDTTACKGWVIRRNICRKVGLGRGINLVLNADAAYSDFVITDNEFSDIVGDTNLAAAVGIYGAPVVGLTISKNIIRRVTVGAAIRIANGGTAIVVSGNEIYDCTTGAVWAPTCVSAYAKGNFLRGNGTNWVGFGNLVNSATINADNTVMA